MWINKNMNIFEICKFLGYFYKRYFLCVSCYGNIDEVFKISCLYG